LYHNIIVNDVVVSEQIFFANKNGLGISNQPIAKNTNILIGRIFLCGEVKRHKPVRTVPPDSLHSIIHSKQWAWHRIRFLPGK